jgi:DNA-directed RNA polymerase specialized sigma24 family protein
MHCTTPSEASTSRRDGGPTLFYVDLNAADFLAKEPPADLEALAEALDELAEEDPAKAELVKLRFITGLAMPEIAQVLSISLATAERHWTYARAWVKLRPTCLGPSGRVSLPSPRIKAAHSRSGVDR